MVDISIETYERNGSDEILRLKEKRIKEGLDHKH